MNQQNSGIDFHQCENNFQLLTGILFSFFLTCLFMQMYINEFQIMALVAK